MHRNLWKETYLEISPPFWPCPACGRETLQPVKQSLATASPSGYEWLAAGSDMTPLDYIYRFKQFFQCAIRECGDIVCVTGDAKLGRNPYSSTSSNTEFIFTLYPRSIHRGLPIINCPIEAPDSVKGDLESAYTLFWVDLGSCANRLRVSVEHALDELGVPAARALNDRINTFEKIDPDHAQTFHALREVGNVGSHQGDNTRETILDAFEVYEDALRNLFGGHRDRIDALKKKIRAAKGK